MKVPVVSVGRFCILDNNSIVKPPSRLVTSSSSSAAGAELELESGKPSKSQTSHTTTAPDASSSSESKSGRVHYPIKIGSWVYVGEGTTIQASQIGSCVYIGKNCNIGEFAIIKDCVVIEDDTVVPPYVTISPFSRVAGKPCKIIEELPESSEQVLEVYCRKIYAGIDVGGPPF